MPTLAILLLSLSVEPARAEEPQAPVPSEPSSASDATRTPDVERPNEVQRRRFRRGSAIALAGTIAVPAGLGIGMEGFKHLNLLGGSEPEPFYAAPMFLGGWGAAILGYPLQLLGTHMQRKALAGAGCPARPKALRFAAPTMLVGAGASVTTELFPSYAETAAGLAIGAWGVSGVETYVLRRQAKACEGLKP
jgi:hypothetical protein